MLDREAEGHWTTVKDSYPDAIVFQEVRGLFVVKGPDLEALAKEFGIRPGGTWMGFDRSQAWAYMTELVERGYNVVRASAGHACWVGNPADRRREIQRQRARGRFLALEPTLVFDALEVESNDSNTWLRRRGYEELFDKFKRWLQDGDWRSFGEYGELYVYQVGDWYEIDLELSSMLQSHALLLAKAAVATGCKMPCRVVEPKPRRQRKSSRRPSRSGPVRAKAPRLGQLGFGDLADGWSS